MMMSVKPAPHSDSLKETTYIIYKVHAHPFPNVLLGPRPRPPPPPPTAPPTPQKKKAKHLKNV